MLWPFRMAVKLFLVVVGILVVYFAVTLVQVWLTSLRYTPRPAQAIVVMGSAQYNGVPSPDLRARLNEALILYHAGLAPLIMVTGSKEKGDRFTEAQAGARYLEYMGVPRSSILEAGGSDSWANLALAAPELQSHGATHVLIVTDPFHEDRSLAIAKDVGLSALPTPTHTSPIKGLAVVPYFLKEAVAVGLGRVIGYKILHQLHEDLGLGSMTTMDSITAVVGIYPRFG